MSLIPLAPFTQPSAWQASDELRRASNEATLRASAMLTVSQLSKSFAGRALFDDVSLQVNRGDRIGLGGPERAD
jgi:ABC-type molybdenum transport system ATPase subunit/photorepair protein PhrA